MFTYSLKLSVLVCIMCFHNCLGADVLNLPEGSKCAFDKYNGTCIKDYKCLSMIKSIKERKIPPICSYGVEGPIICCTDCGGVGNVDIRNATYVRAAGLLFKNGHKAYDKCIDYLVQYPYVCKDHNTFEYDFEWSNSLKCTAYIIQARAPVGGQDAVRGEFPHMALLGYGPDQESLQWQCGGSLISEKYILTAGHCIASAKLGPVSYVALGILKRSDPLELWRLYKVKNIIPHPDYHSPSMYNDIALLETETPVKIDKLVMPACLHTKHYIKKFQYPTHATGWGSLGNRKPVADTLQKVNVEQFTYDECAKLYPGNRNLERGYDNETQMYFGDRNEPKDTCEGDSGGPLEDVVDYLACQYRIMGVTSSGIPCGAPGGAGLYTKVDYYLPWIESIVWP